MRYKNRCKVASKVFFALALEHLILALAVVETPDFKNCYIYLPTAAVALWFGVQAWRDDDIINEEIRRRRNNNEKGNKTAEADC